MQAVERELVEKSSQFKYAKVIFNANKKEYYYLNSKDDLAIGDTVLVETLNGITLAEISGFLNSKSLGSITKKVLSKEDMKKISDEKRAKKVKEEQREILEEIKCRIDYLEYKNKIDFYRETDDCVKLLTQKLESLGVNLED